MKLIALIFALALPAHAARIELVAGGGTKEKDAPATECALRHPFGLEFNPSGEMIIVEMTKGQRVLKVDKDGMLRVIAGTGQTGYSGDGGPAKEATFSSLHNLAILPSGDILLADSSNNALRKIDAKTGIVTTLAGNGKPGYAGDGGPAKEAQFAKLIQIALDPDAKHLLLTDIDNKRVRRIDLASGIIETVAGTGKRGLPPDGAEAKTTPLVDPRAAISDGAGGMYVLERRGNALRHIDAAGKIRTVAGTGEKGANGDGGPALAATMNGPKHLCMDRDGSVVIADAENQVIRRYSPKNGTITRVAGTGKKGSGGLGGDPLKCKLARPHGVTIGPDGMLYIVDSDNHRILRIVP